MYDRIQSKFTVVTEGHSLGALGWALIEAKYVGAPDDARVEISRNPWDDMGYSVSVEWTESIRRDDQ